MSAPETNALSPAPDNTTTLIVSSASNPARISPNPIHISMDIALRFSGWLKVTNPMPPSRAASILPPAYSVVPTFSSISDYSLFAHRGDFGIGVADRLHDFRLMLARIGGIQPDSLRKAGNVDRR